MDERNEEWNNSKDWKVLDWSQVSCTRVNQIFKKQEQGVTDSLYIEKYELIIITTSLS